MVEDDERRREGRMIGRKSDEASGREDRGGHDVV